MLSSVVLSLFLLLIQVQYLAELLALANEGSPGPDAWLYRAALFSSSLALFVPTALMAIGLAVARRRRASRRAFLVLASLTLLIAMLDLELLSSIGRHVVEIAELAFEPQGHIAGGAVGRWVGVVIAWASVAVLATVTITALSQWALESLCRGLTVLMRRTLAAAGIIAVVMGLVGPGFLLDAWGSHPMVERLYASVLVDLRPERDVEGARNVDPRLAELYSRLRDSYDEAFPALTASKPGDAGGLVLPARPPNVVLIVTESLRRDALGPELMPRLSNWADRGLRATSHDAGTNYSQAGMFALLYGRSPVTFHQTLDGRVPPQFCTMLRGSGYECAYFTGHPKTWMRREEFLNERTMDHFVHDDRGDWPDWDHRALGNMLEHVQSSEKPVFAIVLLMSSHFEYRYPSKYEIDRPVADSAWLTTVVSRLGPEAEVPHRNRYRNCMRFLDDLISDAIGELDPDRNLVVFTGDHGESINDDGRYTHGYSFAEVLTRTPLVMAGPGVTPGRLEVPTSHIDVMPTVFHALTGKRPRLQHVHGLDWFAGERRASELAAYAPPGKQRVETQLRVNKHRLRIDLDLTKPTITLFGFEDENARLVSTPALGELEVDEIARAFEGHLNKLRY